MAFKGEGSIYLMRTKKEKLALIKKYVWGKKNKNRKKGLPSQALIKRGGGH